MLGANSSVRDNVLVLLKAMGYRCTIAPNLKDAITLVEKEKPDAAILDPQQADAWPAGMVAAFYRMCPSLRDRTVVLTAEPTSPELHKVLDAYSLPRVPQRLLLQELWPCLDSLLTRNVVPRPITCNARVIFDSFLDPLPADMRNSHPGVHRVLYEAEGVMADLSLEPQPDSQRISLVGQVLDPARPQLQLASVPVVFQGQTGLIGVAKTNEFGEFQFDFDSEPGVRLEIGIRRNHWVLLDLPDPKGTTSEILQESQSPEQPDNPQISEGCSPRTTKNKRAR
jgi:hypothetical protein